MKKPYITSGSLGNILEWFDFGLFVYLAPLIGEKFFPIHDTHSAALAAFGVFAVGFLCRPLGGVVFGYWGDKHSRVKALRWSIFIITFATLAVGFLPTYERAGLLAAILFTLLRLLQGFSVGGEYTGAAIYLAESAPQKHRGFFTSFAASSSNLGFLLATLAVVLLKTTLPVGVIDAWAWRLPFIFAGVTGLCILYYRLRLVETRVYQHLQATHQIEKNPLLSALRLHPRNLLRIAGLTSMGSTLYFIFFGYMPTYLEQQGASLPQALLLQALLLLVMIALIPLAGLLGDYFGRRNMLCSTAIGIVLLALPCFYLLQNHSAVAIFSVLTIASILSAAEQGNTLMAAIENSAAGIRYTTVSFAFNVGNALFGGTAPLVVSILMQRFGYFAPAGYLMTMAILSLMASLSLRRRDIL